MNNDLQSFIQKYGGIEKWGSRNKLHHLQMMFAKTTSALITMPLLQTYEWQTKLSAEPNFNSSRCSSAR